MLGKSSSHMTIPLRQGSSRRVFVSGVSVSLCAEPRRGQLVLVIRRVWELPINMVENQSYNLEPGGLRAPQDDAHGGPQRIKRLSTSCKLPAESRDGARREGASPGEPPQSQAGRFNAMRSSPGVDHERALAIPTGNKSERTLCGTVVSRNQLYASAGSDQNQRLSYSPSSPLTGESGLFLPPSSSTVLSSRASPKQRALLSTQESLQLKGTGDDVTTKDDPQGSPLGVSQGVLCNTCTAVR